MTTCTVPVSYRGNATRSGLVFVRRSPRSLAMSIALRFRDRTPSVAEIRRAYGLSRATAYRYLADLKAAKGGW